MIIPFLFRFRAMKRGWIFYPKWEREVQDFPIDGTIKPSFCLRREDWDLTDEESDNLTDEEHMDSLRNMPNCTRHHFRENDRPLTLEYSIFSLNSPQPFFTKDSLKLHYNDSNHLITCRTAKNVKKWDFSVWRDIRPISILGALVIENVWINNQRRRDMIGYIYFGYNVVNLISLKRRKLILKAYLKIKLPLHFSTVETPSENLSFVVMSETARAILVDHCPEFPSIYWSKFKDKPAKNSIYPDQDFLLTK